MIGGTGPDVMFFGKGKTVSGIVITQDDPPCHSILGGEAFLFSSHDDVENKKEIGCPSNRDCSPSPFGDLTFKDFGKRRGPILIF